MAQLARSLTGRLQPYARNGFWRPLAELLLTAAAFLASLALTMVLLADDNPAAVLLYPCTALLIIRLFTIQHDCGHGSHFRSRRLNDWVGRVVALATLTPYGLWRRDHATHHAGSGNLARRGEGDITLLTVAEYRALSRWARLRYRAYRHPLVLFGLGPSIKYWILYRLPPADQVGRRSVIGYNLALVGLAAGLHASIGLTAFLAAFFPAAMLAASAGVWLFFIQHHFKGAYWRSDAEWDFATAALDGCSLYRLPRLLHWLTNNIGYHHIHHLYSRIPGYRLQRCYDAIPELQQAPQVSIFGGFRLWRLALWDEHTRRLVGFSDVAVAAAPGSST